MIRLSLLHRILVESIERCGIDDVDGNLFFAVYFDHAAFSLRAKGFSGRDRVGALRAPSLGLVQTARPLHPFATPASGSRKLLATPVSGNSNQRPEMNAALGVIEELPIAGLVVARVCVIGDIAVVAKPGLVS